MSSAYDHIQESLVGSFQVLIMNFFSHITMQLFQALLTIFQKLLMNLFQDIIMELLMTYFLDNVNMNVKLKSMMKKTLLFAT